MTTKTLVHRLVFIFLLCSSFTLMATPSLPYIPAPAEPQLAAKSYVLQDNTSGTLIVAKNADERLEPASLTKMMTVYVIDHELKAGRLSLDKNIRISEKAWRAEGSRMFVQVNTEVPLNELLKGIIIQSGNDASIAVAEHIAGTEEGFAQLMNHYAKQLGMTNTHFMNATGLPDPNHYTTARDMATLAHALITEFPETYKIYSEKEFFYNDIKQINRNKLLWRDNTVDGIKTGHTDSAGFCLVASAQRDNMRLNAVIIGADSDSARMDQAQQLLNYGFRFYVTKNLLTADKPIATTAVYQGKAKQVSGGVIDDLYVTIPQGQQALINTQIQIDPMLKAPIERGQTIGSLTITLNNEVLAQHPIVALQSVERGNIFQRFIDWIKLFFKNIFSSSSHAVVETLHLD
jgi:serine-type D-Ala-D-Ala carboxypeptidase (penicillin-binding protein 5/6)